MGENQEVLQEEGPDVSLCRHESKRATKRWKYPFWVIFLQLAGVLLQVVKSFAHQGPFDFPQRKIVSLFYVTLEIFNSAFMFYLQTGPIFDLTDCHSIAYR
jgi:hypothetical protein